MVSINEKAPILAKTRIEIEATPEIIWNIMADIEAWPNWNSKVKKACLKGELKEGTQFVWKAEPGKITSLIQNVEPPHILSWTGRVMGINSVHVWKIEVKDSKTVVESEESWEGMLSSDMRELMQKMLEDSLNYGLKNLKIEAERVSALKSG